MKLAEHAPAKVNLFLHVGRAGDDGRHPLCSLVVFADVGDTVTAQPSDRFTLQVEGPFADQTGPADDNLISRALVLAQAPAMQVSLTKRLPGAAGLGGGTSDAGAALRLAGRLFEDLALDRLEAAARLLGADGLMCLRAVSCLAEGEGEVLTPAPALPVLPAVLVNPGTPSPTGAVYRAYDEGVGAFRAERPQMPPSFESVDAVASFLEAQRNDLEAPAIRLAPEIATAISAVGREPDARLVRMSGSGATVFGLFASDAAAAAAAARLEARYPSWWVRPCRLNNST